jgi:hypothetical protein
MKLRILKYRFLNLPKAVANFFTLFLLLSLPSISLAQTPSWITSLDKQPLFGNPNTFGIGPRAMGMGGAFTAIADDTSAVYWNPAGLAQISSYEISISGAPVYFQNNINPIVPASNGFANNVGFPWVESFQFILPIDKDNTLGLSFFRPFHPQTNYYSGNTVLTPLQAADSSYLLNPTFQESEIILSYSACFAGVNNFSVGINVKRITNDPDYIEYFSQYDPSIANELSGSGIGVVGYGVDLGILYRIPITKYSEEFRVGLSFQNLDSQVQYTTGLVISPTLGDITNLSVGSGYSTHIPSQVTLGLAYKNDFLFRVRNITDLDFDQISDPRFDSASNKIIRFGTEFWFFNDVVGLRGGYSSPLNDPGTVSLGLSLRPLNGDFDVDLAYLLPVSPAATQAQGTDIATTAVNSIYFEDFYLGLTYSFGGGEELPPPKVSAFVRPSAFMPSLGEKASFYLDTSEDVTVNHWTVLIYDQNNNLVRGLRGVGAPPSRIVWDGENDQYEPLPAGVYTWAFQVQDQLNHIGSTPVQSVEILAPEGPKEPTKLLELRQQQSRLLTQERQKLTALAQQNLNNLLGIEEPKNATKTAAALQPVEAIGNTINPDAGTVPIMSFNNLSPDQVLNAHFDKNTTGESTVVVNYRSNLSYVPYLYQEAIQVIKTTVNSVGKSVKEINTHVYYGKNELDLSTPALAADNYASGRINETVLLQLSDVRINGQKVKPNAE